MSTKTLRLEEYLWSANRKVARGIEGIYKKTKTKTQNKTKERRESVQVQGMLNSVGVT